jgi:2-iminobutanoate/2-iminopropanoate deaminase
MDKLPFSRFKKAGNLIFTSGQVHLKDGELVGETVSLKTKQVMENLKAVLSEAGVTFENVIKSTVYVTDMGMYGEFNKEYVKYFTNSFPAREVVCVRGLPLGASIEVSVVAKK